ncbi:MAG TPA: glycosyltransferase family 2 protein [Pyrinomonadaceae bacterium]|jgi:teichuronic acid biosynthesis glycosyltransferase TuaG
MQHLVSIIMPAYNAEKYIAESIRSVLAQTYQDWELIVTDDGSTDKTAEIVQGFSSTDDRIKYIFQQNGGLGKARNTGIKAARGDLIAFLDSDDLWLREKLALQIEMLEETGADLVFCDAFIFPEDDTTNETRSFSMIYGRFQGAGRYNAGDMYRLLLVSNPIPVLSVLVRKEILDGTGLFEEDERYWGCEDYDLWFKLVGRGAVFYGSDGKLGRYRFHANAMSRKIAKIYRAEIAVLERYKPGPGPDYNKLKERIKETYRLVIATLIKENRLDEAGESVKALAVWDSRGLVTLLQRALIRAMPGRFNPVSERLYKAEQLIKSIKSIRGRRTMSRLKRFWRKLSPERA